MEKIEIDISTDKIIAINIENKIKKDNLTKVHKNIKKILEKKRKAQYNNKVQCTCSLAG